MPLPNLLLNAQLPPVPVPLMPRLARLAAMAGGVAPALQLNFSMQRQLQTEWCWSAVATSVSHFFNNTSQWTQCTLANSNLGQATCCANGSSAACNRSFYLNQALTLTGNLLTWAAGAIGGAAVGAEIAKGNPLGCRIQWSDTSGHFVVISSYYFNGNTEMVDVKDPWYGDSSYDYAAFISAYRNDGTCTHVYYTPP